MKLYLDADLFAQDLEVIAQSDDYLAFLECPEEYFSQRYGPNTDTLMLDAAILSGRVQFGPVTSILQFKEFLQLHDISVPFLDEDGVTSYNMEEARRIVHEEVEQDHRAIFVIV